jgi:hypothetical protein
VPGLRQADWNAGFLEIESDSGTATNNYTAAYLSAVETIVTALQSQVSHWEIWNEPNNWTAFNPDDLVKILKEGKPPPAGENPLALGNFYIYPSVYATLLRDVPPRIKAIQPSASVLSGGMLCMNPNATGVRAYVANLLRRLQGTPLVLDAIGQHLYLTDEPAQGSLQTRLEGSLTALKQQLAATGRNLPIHVTEAGFKSMPSPDQNAVAMAGCTALFAACAAVAEVDALCWFTLHDVIHRPPSKDDIRYGLVDSGGTPKPGVFDLAVRLMR